MPDGRSSSKADLTGRKWASAPRTWISLKPRMAQRGSGSRLRSAILLFIEAKNGAAREVALAFGVPPMLLGIPGDNTFANFAEANRTFWRQTVVPLVGRVAEAISHFVTPTMGAVRLVPDLDQVEALSPDRDALWKRVNDAGFLSDDEKREAVGYGRGQFFPHAGLRLSFPHATHGRRQSPSAVEDRTGPPQGREGRNFNKDQ